ncbi:MAG: hypothetical protein GMKNLPBB_03340 [Myxococcota bacterium]|nr:hypothetical protein [Myxococcota bacterium]
MDKVALPGKETFDGIGQVARQLRHPCAVGIRHDAGDLHLTGGQIDHEEHGVAHQTEGCPHLDAEEVGGGKRLPVGAQKLPPRGAFGSLRYGLKSVLFEDVGHGPPTDPMTQIGQGALDARVPPSSVLLGEPNDQLPDHLHHPGPSRPTASTAVVLAGDEFSMPTQQCVRRDDGG